MTITALTAGNQLCRPDVQPVRELHDIEQADVPFPALDPAHVVPP